MPYFKYLLLWMAMPLPGTALLAATEPDDSLMRRVREEYPAALGKLEHPSVPVRGTAVVRKELNVDRPDRREVERVVEFSLNSDRRKLVETVGPPDHRQEFVYCATPSYAFTLERTDGRGPYLVRNFSVDPKPIERTMLFKVLLALDPAWRVNAFSFVSDEIKPMSSILDDHLNNTNCKLVDAVEETGEAAGLIRMRWEYPYTINKKPYVGIDTIVADPSEDWALRRFEFGWREPATGKSAESVRSIDVRYRPAAGGPRTPERVELKHSAVEREVYEFKDLRFGEIPAREFTFEYYGLPNLVQPGGEEGRGWAAWLLFGLAFVCLVGGLVLNYYGSFPSRKRSAAGTR